MSGGPISYTTNWRKLMSTPIISVIAAYTRPDSAYGTGDFRLPWPTVGGLPGDLQRFYRHTTDAPEGKVNVLIGGRNTVQSMREVILGKKRLLVGVSTSIEPGNGYGHNRSFVQSIDVALRLAEEEEAHRIIFIGGEAIWLHGLNIADEAYLTIAMRDYPEKDAVRLKTPLHIIAKQRGMTLTRCDTCITPADMNAWANYEAQIWKMKP